MPRYNSWNLSDSQNLSQLSSEGLPSVPYHDWIRSLRNYLRMTQSELAKRAKITQPHLAAIESGKTDPQIGTLRKIFAGLSCDLVILPRPKKEIEEILRSQAGSVALKRLKQSMGTMALENQAPDEEAFRHLLKKKTEEILEDRREHLWKTDE